MEAWINIVGRRLPLRRASNWRYNSDGAGWILREEGGGEAGGRAGGVHDGAGRASVTLAGRKASPPRAPSAPRTGRPSAGGRPVFAGLLVVFAEPCFRLPQSLWAG